MVKSNEFEKNESWPTEMLISCCYITPYTAAAAGEGSHRQGQEGGITVCGFTIPDEITSRGNLAYSTESAEMRPV